MKKRMLTMMLALMLIVSVIPFAASAAQTDAAAEQHVHSIIWSKEVVIKNPTCKETGVKYIGGLCSTCGTFLDEVSIPTTAHSYTNGICTGCGDACEHNYRIDVCTKCGAACPHDYELVGYVDNKAPTCTSPATGIYKCKICDAPENIAVGKAEHTPVAYDEIPAKCGEEGRSGGKYCSECNAHLEDRTILAPLEHKYTKFDKQIRKPTCKEYGLDKYLCEYCGVASENKIVEKAAHTPVAYEEIPATCEEDGRTGGKYCSVCEKHLEDRTVLKKLGHNITADPATMIGEAKTPATCTTAGSGIFRCANKGCDAYARRDIPALGHKLVTWKGFDATCLEEGRTDGEWCERCTKDHITKQRQVIAKKDHDFKFVRYSVGNEPTCLEDGVSRYECTTKGCTAVDHRATKALGHDDKVLENWPATCTSNGCTKYECQREGCPEKIRYVDSKATGHAPETLPAVEATCSITGLTEGKQCATCQAILEAQTVIEKKAHTWTDVAGVNATCTENGYTSHKKCSVCGTVEGKSVIEASHYYNDVRCTVCGEANPEYVAPDHGDHDKDDHNKPGHGGNHGHPDFIDPDDNGDNKPDQGGNNVESEDKDDNKQPSQGGNNGGSGDKDHNHRVCKHEHQTTVTQEKTCTTNGSVISYCTDCETVITVTPDVATGHNFVMGACAVCGEHDPAVYTNDFNNYYIVGGSTK